MIKVWKKQPMVLIPYLGLIIMSVLLLGIYGKATIHIFINETHHPVADQFFKYFTNLGDGIFAVILVLVLLFVHFKQSLVQSVAAVLAGLGSQILKRSFFTEVARPARFFENDYTLYFVEGVKIHRNFSFPSGHTATAFALFFCLILFTKNYTLQFLYLIMAILVGYSRMYLSLHFLPDVLAGSIIGVLAAMVSYVIINRFHRPWMDGRIHFSNH